ncbi:MerR family transcriptional regulator [Spirillospora sp. CA-294931]|uniref:MerR family transcriptional regulator n=1 Tax=Spirillospora sp. CA-294931 TaxID=3240042 RepID=UPI003D94F55B
MRTSSPYPYSTGEVARLFGVSARTVWRWTQEGKLGTIKTPGGQLRYRSEDVDALLAMETPSDLVSTSPRVALERVIGQHFNGDGMAAMLAVADMCDIAVSPSVDTRKEQHVTDHPPHRKHIGELALAHGIDDGTWIGVRPAVELTGLSSAQIKNWEQHGVISCLQEQQKGNRKYLREELALVAELRDRQEGCRPKLNQVKHLITKARGGQAEVQSHAP